LISKPPSIAIVIIGLSVSLVAPRNASADVLQFMSIGYGSTSCGTWTAARKTKPWDTNIYRAWVLGFLSGYNGYYPTGDRDISKGTDNEALMAWIDNYCAERPLDAIADAAQMLIVELNRRKNSN
jgi:hypothetical protein